MEVVFERVEEGVREVDWENYRGGEDVSAGI